MLLSIRPRYVERILAGDKTVELRRTKPLVDVGQPIAIYSTLPAGAIVATARVARVEQRAKQELWEARRRTLGVSKDEFNSYFAGRSHAVGVHLDLVAPLEAPVSLSQMRVLGVPNPPQQWMFLRSSDWGRRLNLAEPAAA
ncbi:hypothetical protein GCM10025876_18110 [Demequina litorisediminis]|uniref:ASCH domain-containing protein n=2 Tax=Demequina litorisediminis TaxID=1849022 RepID=A0ABQ6ICP5_9MICO|nr:hypothetical protein GCM10025876_18110 [Demequina litorisediminis]